MVDFEEFLKELITTKEILKKLKKDLENELSAPKFVELKNELTEVSQRISELNQTLQKWIAPDEALDKISKLRKELTVVNRLLEDINSQVEFINNNLHIKPKKFTTFFILSVFLGGFALGVVFSTIFKKVKVNLNGISLETNKCIKVSKGIVKIHLEGKQFELPANKIKLKICPPKGESGR